MAYTDKQLTCVGCGVTFAFTAREQERFAQLGFTNEPKRCLSCRQKRKAEAKSNSRDTGISKEFHDIICSECGKPGRVPFKPRGDRPIYCSACFEHR